MGEEPHELMDSLENSYRSGVCTSSLHPNTTQECEQRAGSVVHPSDVTIDTPDEDLEFCRIHLHNLGT